jgi:small GTP-binding protein
MSKSVDAKVVFLGSANVGKTSIICRAISDEFSANISSTIGACFASKQVHLKNTAANLQIWDTAGQERFRTIAPMYYRGAAVAVLVFSVTDEKSFQDVETWATEVLAQASDIPELFVVANKIDLGADRIVRGPEIEVLAKKLRAETAEVSAKSGIGVDELFVRVAEIACKKVMGVLAAAGSLTEAQIIDPGESQPKQRGSCCG